MRRPEVGLARLFVLLLLFLLLLLAPLSRGGRGDAASGRHTIFMTAAEIKGGTTTDKLEPPPINPADLSKGTAIARRVRRTRRRPSAGKSQATRSLRGSPPSGRETL